MFNLNQTSTMHSVEYHLERMYVVFHVTPQQNAMVIQLSHERVLITMSPSPGEIHLQLNGGSYYTRNRV